MRGIRGDAVSMIFQEPMTSLNPVHTVGEQIIEAIRPASPASTAAEARSRATLEMLRLVKIPSPETRLDEYPHQLSGGMRQRVMIAMALACDPKILIADEPTTALDVTIQAQILDLLRDLRERTGTAIMLITHDLGVVAEIAHRVIVMYAGRIVEEAPVEPAVRRSPAPLHAGPPGLDPAAGQRRRRAPAAPSRASCRIPSALPAGCRFSPRCPLADARCKAEQPPAARDRARPSRRLLEGAARRRRLPTAAARVMQAKPLLSVAGLTKHFPVKRGIVFQSAVGTVRAVDGLTFDVAPGETLALVGESGCGKSTTGRMVLRLIEATAGHDPLRRPRCARTQPRRAARPAPRHADHLPGSLRLAEPAPDGRRHPGRAVRACTGSASGAASRQRIDELLGEVGLSAWHALRYPHEFSGGQRQRIGIARALASQPEADRLRRAGVGARRLDPGAGHQPPAGPQAQARPLLHLHRPRSRRGAPHIGDRVAVMYLGKIVELAPKRSLFAMPRHPYTQALLVGGAGARSHRPARPHPAGRRRAEPAQPARTAAASTPAAPAPRTAAARRSRCCDRSARKARSSPATSPRASRPPPSCRRAEPPYRPPAGGAAQARGRPARFRPRRARISFTQGSSPLPGRVRRNLRDHVALNAGSASRRSERASSAGVSAGAQQIVNGEADVAHSCRRW